MKEYEQFIFHEIPPFLKDNIYHNIIMKFFGKQ